MHLECDIQGDTSECNCRIQLYCIESVHLPLRRMSTVVPRDTIKGTPCCKLKFIV
jgi:hypothetical protein